MNKNVFTSNYGIARSIIALGNIITLTFTNVDGYFNEVFFKVNESSSSIIPNIFAIFGADNIQFSVISSVIILLWVISGYLPQVTGILHAWVNFSFFSGSIIIEGGDQISQIITLLLIPITLFDKRINHWHKQEFFSYKRPKFIEYFCYSSIVIIQLQMAILYLFAGADKLKVTEWLDGSAIYYWFNNSPFGAPGYMHFLFDWIITDNHLLPLVTWGVIVLELLLFAAFFMTSKNKMTLFFFAIFFHFMIVLVHGLFTFFLSMAGGLILYLLPFDFFDRFGFYNSILFRQAPKSTSEVTT